MVDRGRGRRAEGGRERGRERESAREEKVEEKVKSGHYYLFRFTQPFAAQCSAQCITATHAASI